MCGICGYISQNPVDEKQLINMTDTLTHRGPDDSGVWMCDDNGYHIGFGHRRLSIFDLSAQGHQPMIIGNGELAVTYNGEIYNFKKIRNELEKEGYIFNSNCDTEVLLNAYHKWGDECVNKFNGMFAFAIYDKVNHRAIFARDRIGKKPLFYFYNNRTLIFGSEMKALMIHPEFVKEIDRKYIAAYLSSLCYYAPHTVFVNTYKLEPGCMLIWENGAVNKRAYWDLLQKHEENSTYTINDENEAKEGLKTHIRKSVEQRLAADVPVGVLLSGGIDSTVVASIAAELSKKPIKTFSIGFYETECNEAVRAKKTAEYLGTEHTELYVSQEELLGVVADIPCYYDEPFADSSQIPTMLVSRLARQNVTVALSGDGGDELFCGYNWYERKSLKKSFGGIAWELKNSKTGGITGSLLPKAVKSLFDTRYLNAREQLRLEISEQITKKMMKTGNAVSRFNVDKMINSKNRQERCMLFDMLTYLPDDILCKVDRASMRYALELRCPLLDADVIEYSFRVPMNMKYRNGEKKWLLKQAVYDYIPQDLLDMPKSGFCVPLGKWLRCSLNEMVIKYIDKEKIEEQEIFRYDIIKWLSDRVMNADDAYVQILWSYLMFQMWYQRYIEDLW